MRFNKKHWLWIYPLCVSPLLAQAPVARVGDVTRLQGQSVNVLMGYGLVAGLEGTGDGDQFRPAINSLTNMMRRFGANVGSPDELSKAKNVAVVTIEVIIPDHGAREGDVLDVSISALAAKSLRGGRLLPTPLVYHDRNVDGLFGYAQGGIVLEGNIETSGVIRGGARMERDVLMSVLSKGSELRGAGFLSSWISPEETYITLVLDESHAGWSMAAAIAQAVDKELSISADVERVALALDSKSIAVLVPAHQSDDPASWIRDVEQTPILMESNEARVTINRKVGTIVITGDTRLSPVVVSQRGMTVTVLNPREDGTIPLPVAEERQFVALDSKEDRQPNVADLLEALNRLKVPFMDRVSILEEIHRAGKLHAKLMYEG